MGIVSLEFGDTVFFYYYYIGLYYYDYDHYSRVLGCNKFI